MGIFAGLSGESYDRNYNTGALLRRIWAYVKPYKKKLFLILLVVMVRAVTGALPPVLVSRVLDGQLATNPNFNSFFWLVFAVIFIEVSGFVFYYLLQPPQSLHVVRFFRQEKHNIYYVKF